MQTIPHPSIRLRPFRSDVTRGRQPPPCVLRRTRAALRAREFASAPLFVCLFVCLFVRWLVCVRASAMHRRRLRRSPAVSPPGEAARCRIAACSCCGHQWHGCTYCENTGTTSMVYREQAKRLEAYEQERLQRADELEQKRLQREQARGAWRGPMGSHSPLLHSNFKFPRALGFVSVPLAAWQHPHSKLRCTRMTTRTPYSTLYSTVTPCITMITPCSSGLPSLSLAATHATTPQRADALCRMGLCHRLSRL